MAEVQFFGEVDRNKAGDISSDMPAWFFDTQVNDIEEKIASKKREIDRGDIPIQYFAMKKQDLNPNTPCKWVLAN